MKMIKNRKYAYTSPVIILRKKIAGENSIEEISSFLERNLNITVLVCPHDSISFLGIVSNILFFRKIIAPVYHIIAPSEAYLLPFLRSGKKIITYHDLQTMFMSPNPVRRFLRYVFNVFPSKYFADDVIFVSEQTESEYARKTKVKNKEKRHIIYNAYDERLIPLSKEKKDSVFTILHIGTAVRKNLIGMIEACRGLHLKLVIVGRLSKEQREKLETYTIAYENMFDIPYETIVACYNLCDIVSFPTFYEGFGIPAIEANRMQKPVIVGDIPIMHEVCNDAAYFVNPTNVSEIRTAVISLMESPALREYLVKRGIENAQRFKAEHILNQYRQLYGL